MREIKFRAWDGYKIHYPVNFEFGISGVSGKTSIAFVPFGSLGYTTTSHIMQYTGLKDKNGVEIYEGDIIIIEDVYKDIILDDGTGPSEPFNHLAPVAFKQAEYGVDIKDGADIFCSGFWSFQSIRYETGQDDYEVIGNICENPELLK